VVVDTNVILVANGQHQDISPQCTATCALKLQSIINGGKLALDDCFLILTEYQKKTTPRSGSRPGDAFVKWALQNNANVDRVECVSLKDHATRGFEDFPDDPALARFDPSDRIFVAASRAHPDKPPILQAADSKWLSWASALAHRGVVVEFLCPDDIERFNASKSKQ
jgi:hypothetical protein